MLGNLPITVTSEYGNLLPYTYGIMYRMRHTSRAYVTCMLSLSLSLLMLAAHVMYMVGRSTQRSLPTVIIYMICLSMLRARPRS